MNQARRISPAGDHIFVRTLFILLTLFAALPLGGCAARARVPVDRSADDQNEKTVTIELSSAPVLFERTLSSGQTRHYRFKLKKGQYLHAIVEQDGVDVTLALLGPFDKVLIERDSPNGNHGPESLSWTATSNGNYRLAVRANRTWAQEGKYRLRIEPIRSPNARDTRRMAAEEALHQATLPRWGLKPEDRTRRLEALNAALSGFRDSGDRYWEGLVLLQLCDSYGAKSPDWERGQSYCEQALQVYTAMEDGYDSGLALEAMGDRARERVDLKLAREDMEKALGLFRSAGSRKGEARLIKTLVQICAAQKDGKATLDYAAQNLEMIDQTDIDGRETGLEMVGLAQLEFGDPSQALSAFEQALPLARHLGDWVSQATVLYGQGRASLRLGRPEAAAAALQSALTAATGVRCPSAERIIRSALTEASSTGNASSPSGEKVKEVSVTEVGDSEGFGLYGFFNPLGSSHIAQAEMMSTAPKMLNTLEVHGTLRANISASARRAGVSGNGLVEVTIGRDGRAVNARLIQGTDLFRDAFLTAARVARFEPQPAAFKFRQPFIYTIR